MTQSPLPAAEEPAPSHTSTLRGTSDKSKVGFSKCLLHNNWRTSFRLSVCLAEVWSQYASPLSVASLTSHSIFDLLLQAGLRTVTSLILSLNMKYKFSPLRSLDAPVSLPHRATILVHKRSTSVFHHTGVEDAQHSRLSRSQRQFIHSLSVLRADLARKPNSSSSCGVRLTCASRSGKFGRIAWTGTSVRSSRSLSGVVSK